MTEAYDDIWYNGKHAITISVDLKEFEGELSKISRNTWEDWHLVPVSRPVIVPPSQKTTTIDIPGVDGVIDLSTTLTGGRPVYNNRQGQLVFYVINGYGKWCDRLSEIMNYLNGSGIEIYLNDDNWTLTSENGNVWEGHWFYKGRFWVGDWTSPGEGPRSTITFEYDLEPYKYRWIPADPDTPGIGSDSILDRSL